MNMSEQTAGATRSASGDKGLRRFFVVGIAFLIYEAVLIVVFGDNFYADVASTIGSWGMVAVAAAGYFALGYVSRSWYSAAFLIAMLLVAAAIGKPGPTFVTATGPSIDVHQNPDSGSLWLTLSLVFVPVWAVGTFIAKKQS